MCFGVLHIYLLQSSNLMHLLTTFDFRETDLEIDYVRRDSGSDFWVFTREVQVKISDQFPNDSLLCLDTITALGLQYVYVRKAGRFIGEFASEIIESREHYIHRNGGELSWEFLDELSSVVAPCNIGILTFLKSHHCCSASGGSFWDRPPGCACLFWFQSGRGLDCSTSLPRGLRPIAAQPQAAQGGTMEQSSTWAKICHFSEVGHWCRSLAAFFFRKFLGD